MNDENSFESIRSSLQGLAPERLELEGPLALAKTTGELRTLMHALVDFSEKLNAPRKVQLLRSETARLKTEIAELQQSIEQTEQLDQQSRELTATRNELQAKFDLVKDLERQKGSIRELRDFLNGKDPGALLQELQQLQKERQGDIETFNGWLTEAKTLLDSLHGEFLAETKQLLSTVAQKHQDISTDLEHAAANFSQETVFLSHLITSYHQQLGETTENYRNLVTQLEEIKVKLKEIKDKHTQNMQVYKLHFMENKLIYGELGKRHRLDDHLKDLFAGIETKLRWFDEEIKTLVEKSDQLTIV